MAVEFPCQYCGRMLRAMGHSAGQRLLCPGCGALSEIPAEIREVEGMPRTSGGRPASPPGEQSAGGAPGANPFAPVGPAPAGTYDTGNPYQSPVHYGTPADTAPGYGPAAPTDSRAVASLVLGICGIMGLFCCPLIGLPLGIVGLVLGMPAMRSPSRSMAIAGVVCSIMSMVIGLLYVLGMAALFVFISRAAPGAPPPPGF